MNSKKIQKEPTKKGKSVPRKPLKNSSQINNMSPNYLMHSPGALPNFANPYGPNFFQQGGHPINPQRNPMEYLQKFFGGFGIEFPVKMPAKNKNKKNITTSNNNDLSQITVHQDNINEGIYDQTFINYGSNFDDRFRNNYSMNFRSNLEKEAFDYLLSIIRGNRVSQKKHPPTKKSVLNSLKKFDMTEKYCKLNNNSLEYPNCCICINDIVLKQKAVLIPCGHILHWKCAEMWLKKNNTCPLCRFELPGEY